MRKRESISTLTGKAASRALNVVVMLLRQNGRRHEHGHLLAVLHRFEGRPQRDFGLAVAHIAADQRSIGRGFSMSVLTSRMARS